MHYGIMDQGGNMLAWYETEADARAALEQTLAGHSEDASENLTILAFDENGDLVEDSEPQEVIVQESPWLERQGASYHVGAVESGGERTRVPA
jgi:hypothetical protein